MVHLLVLIFIWSIWCTQSHQRVSLGIIPRNLAFFWIFIATRSLNDVHLIVTLITLYIFKIWLLLRKWWTTSGFYSMSRWWFLVWTISQNCWFWKRFLFQVVHHALARNVFILLFVRAIVDNLWREWRIQILLSYYPILTPNAESTWSNLSLWTNYRGLLIY